MLIRCWHCENIACNDRWEEDWRRLAKHRLDTLADRAKKRSNAESCEPIAIAFDALTAHNQVMMIQDHPAANGLLEAVEKPKRKGHYRPPPNHPWRGFTFGSARYRKSNGLVRA